MNNININISEEELTKAVTSLLESGGIPHIDKFAQVLVNEFSVSGNTGVLLKCLLGIYPEIKFHVGQSFKVSKQNLYTYNIDYDRTKEAGLIDENDWFTVKVIGIDICKDTPYQIEYSYYRLNQEEIYQTSFRVSNQDIENEAFISDLNLGDFI